MEGQARLKNWYCNPKMSLPGMVGKEMLLWVEKNTFHCDLLLWILEMKNKYSIIKSLNFFEKAKNGDQWFWCALRAHIFNPIPLKNQDTASWMLFLNLIFITEWLKFFAKDYNNSSKFLMRFAPLYLLPFPH